MRFETRNKVLRVAAFFILFAVVYLVWSRRFGQYLTLERIKAHEAELESFRSAHPVKSIAIFGATYVFMSALSIPGAALLTLAAGAIFGFWTGLAVVSFASTIGATFAFLVARFVFGDFVRERFRDKLERADEDISGVPGLRPDAHNKEWAFFLFALRLVPIFPFFVVNLVMSTTPIPLGTFYWVSQIGMLPGTAVYVNAGTQLARIHSLKGILGPRILLSFAIVGIFPLIAKSIVDFLKSRRNSRRFKSPARFDYNLLVIGGGSAGLVSAYIASILKARVALVERARMGGDCLNTGCIPSKALIRSARILSYARRAREFGFKDVKVDFDFKDVMERVQRVIGKVAPHDSIERYRDLGVECFQGEAKLLSPYEVEANGKILAAKNIILATGAQPFAPSIPGIEIVGYRTSDTIWALRELPRRLLVLGGGPVGCELAQCFQRFGSRVTLAETASRVLNREDEDVSAFVAEGFEKEGMAVLTGHQAKRFVKEGGRKFLICETPGREVQIEFDELLLALGRRANVRGFGLEELGIELGGEGTIAVDEYLRATKFPNIYACGDVAGPYQLTHVAAHQAWYATMNALFGPFKKFKVDYRVIPWATFTDPEVGRVGLNETEARRKGVPYSVARFSLDDLDRAIADEEDRGFIKVLTRPGTDKILGVTIVGEHAGDVIAEYVLAMRYGQGLNKLLRTIHIYPTLAEMNKYVAGAWKKENAPPWALSFLQRYHSWRRGNRQGTG